MRRLTLGLSLMLAIALLAAASARAFYDPLASGNGKLSLASSFHQALKREGIAISGRKGARVEGSGTVVLPVAGGEVDPITEKGSFELGGELVLSRGSRSARLSFLTVNTKPSPLYAKVDGGQQKLVKAKSARFLRRGFDYTYEAEGLRLSKKTATRLDKRLQTDAFRSGQLLGKLAVTASPATVAVVPVGRASLTLDQAFAAKLSSLFVSRNPIFPAEHQGDAFTVPVAAEGRLAPDASQGTLRTSGSIELLQLGAGQLFWKELWFQPGEAQALAEAELLPSPPYPGKHGQVGVFSLGPGQLVSSPTARTISVTGAPLTLTVLTAQDLNEAFSRPLGKGDLFAAGERAGALSFTAQGQ